MSRPENDSFNPTITNVTRREQERADRADAKRQADGMRIRDLREMLQVTQEDFAEHCGVRRNAVLLWESGRSSPSAKAWRKMAKIAGRVSPQNAFWFWEMAGIDRDVFEDIFPEFERMARDTEKRVMQKVEATTGDFALVPLLRAPAPALTDLAVAVPPENIEDYLSIPKNLIQTSERVYALRVSEEFFRPIFDEGDLLVIDPFGPGFADLEDKLVAIRYVPVAETRNIAERNGRGQPIRDYMYGQWPFLPEGIYVGWLHTDPPVKETNPPAGRTAARQMNLNSSKIVTDLPVQAGIEFSVPVAWVAEPHPGDKRTLIPSEVALLGRVVCWFSAKDSIKHERATNDVQEY